jgi:glycosyltransferase involved in cell wall biosynthesis
MLLDILIPTQPSRLPYFQQLIACLSPQLTRDDVGLIVLSGPSLAEGGPSIGVRRNRLLAKVTAEYVVMCDDDDLVHPQYIEKITAALAEKPDCVGFKMRRFYDGIDIGDGINSIKCGGYRNEGHTFYRTPGHLNPIRREIAQSVAYEDLDRLEDITYAAAIFPLLKTEFFVDEYLYEYWFRSPRARVAEADLSSDGTDERRGTLAGKTSRRAWRTMKKGSIYPRPNR